MDLRNKNILIVGGARVGQTVAETLGQAGATVLMTYYQDPHEVADIVARLQERGKAEAFALDVTEAESSKILLANVTNKYGALDGLINMASVFSPDPPEITAQVVADALAITQGTIVLSRWFANAAKARQARLAPIVSFIDWAVDHPYAHYDLYMAGKAALRHYLMALQTTFAGIIRVVNIHPGMILAPPHFPAAQQQSIMTNTPTQSIGDPQQAAALVRVALESDFLADNIYLDGGQHWRHRI